jgi:hypothetical protein
MNGEQRRRPLLQVSARERQVRAIRDDSVPDRVGLRYIANIMKTFSGLDPVPGMGRRPE